MYSSVLIVDDSNIDRFISETVIRKDGFAARIISYNAVDKGLEYLQSHADNPEELPEIIFLDVNMPVMDGFDFLNNFLNLPESIQKHCTIFMISATNSVDDFERIKSYPIVRKFFEKPLSIETLNAIKIYMDSAAHKK